MLRATTKTTNDVIAEAAIVAALGSPIAMTVDGTSTQRERLVDLIKAAEYFRARAAGGTRARGFVCAKLIPPGTI
jgi:hypothetical protein